MANNIGIIILIYTISVILQCEQVPSGDKPLPEPVLIEISEATWHN